MIKMKALKSFGVKSSNEGKVHRGREFSAASETRARDLEDEGLAYRIQNRLVSDIQEQAAAPVSNKAADAGPLDLVGGAIGADAPAPSSQAAPARRRRRSTGSEDGSQS